MLKFLRKTVVPLVLMNRHIIKVGVKGIVCLWNSVCDTKKMLSSATYWCIQSQSEKYLRTKL